jgi:hypothetical protein
MWEPRRLKCIWASTAYYRDSFTIFFCVYLVLTGMRKIHYCYYYFCHVPGVGYVNYMTWIRIGTGFILLDESHEQFQSLGTAYDGQLLESSSPMLLVCRSPSSDQALSNRLNPETCPSPESGSLCDCRRVTQYFLVSSTILVS